MKKVLIVIHDMEIGGAQKSLLSFCQVLATSDISKKYEINLMVVNPVGTFITQIPDNIKMKQPPKELRWIGTPFSIELIRRYFSFRCLVGEILWIVRNHLGLFPHNWNLQQKLWRSWRRIVPMLDENYDIAISYMDGVPNYYAMEKVHAQKKVLWFHSEYQKQGYDPQYDLCYYGKSDAIVTISEKCRDCLLQEFSQHGEKIHVLENITSAQLLDQFSQMYFPEEYLEKKCFKILSVGRLHFQKGFDLAVHAAKELEASGVDFFWWIVGDGSEREGLQDLIEREGISHRIKLLGARENPYPYIRHCDLLVQPSRLEGKSIVLDEAKILCKPIVVTNYTTVSASIEHGVDGWIVEMNSHGIAHGIQELYENPAIRDSLSENLQKQAKGNEAEMLNYINIMF